MFRIPRDKVYRAFTELDGFSDEDCARLIQRARNDAGFDGWLIAAALVTGVILFGVMFSLALAWEARITRWMWPPMSRGTASTIALAIVLLFVMVVPTKGALLARDVVYVRLMRRTIRQHMEKIRCLQ